MTQADSLYFSEMIFFQLGSLQTSQFVLKCDILSLKLKSSLFNKESQLKFQSGMGCYGEKKVLVGRLHYVLNLS